MRRALARFLPGMFEPEQAELFRRLRKAFDMVVTTVPNPQKAPVRQSATNALSFNVLGHNWKASQQQIDLRLTSPARP